jgi:hypothetical protein
MGTNCLIGEIVMPYYFGFDIITVAHCKIDENVGGSWLLVRRVAPGTTWHPAKFDF